MLRITNGNSSTLVRWLTFRGARADTGAAILSSGSPRIENCRFENNRADSLGGAIWGSNVQIVNCEFATNYAGEGGGAVFCTGSPLIKSSTFRSNQTPWNGGAVNIRNGEVRDCLFESNHAGREGGGVEHRYEGWGVFYDCVFRGNSADWAGGGANSLQGPFVRCTFETNHAGGSGGGLSASFGSAEYCRFLGNTAGNEGGGLADGATATRCTFIGNGAPHGGAIYASGVSRCVVQGSLQGGGFYWPYPGTPNIECSDLYSNAGGDWVGPIAGLLGINGNFSADPLFCNPSAGQLSLSTASPLLPQNNECGVQIGSEGQGCESGGIVVSTFPPGLPLEVDGVSVVGPTAFNWSAGSSHTIGTTALYSPLPGVRNEFQTWSDEGALAHAIIAPSSPSAFIATFLKTYLLTMEADSGGVVQPATGWVHARDTTMIAEVPDANYVGIGWTGTGVGSYTGPNQTTQFSMIAPITERAHFEYVGNYPLTMIAQGGGTVQPASGDYHVGTHVTIRASRPPGYVFTGWTGEGVGSYTGSDSVKSITILGPIAQTATFQYVGFLPLTMQSVGGGTVTPPSGTVPAQWPVLITATPSPGYVFYRWVGEGSGSYSGTDWSALIYLNEPVTQTACFAQGGNFPLLMSATAGGVIFPISGDRPAGSTVSIGAIPQSGWAFREWQGTGFGSYSGPLASVSLTMHGPITEHAVFEPDTLGHGYEFSISSSATDPLVNVDTPAGGYRSLYLWLLCGQGGLAAFEAGVSSTLPVAGFSTADGVFDAEPGPDLLLAVAGCPGKTDVPRLLGTWVVQDLGGEICLGPSEVNGLIGAVDCGTQPSFWADPRVYGFSSSVVPPCVAGANACDSIGPVSLVLSQLEATVAGRAVNVAWVTSAETNHARFHVWRSELGYDVYRQLTPELVVGRSPYHYVDASVEGDHVYFYKVGAVDGAGQEVLYGPVSVTTPRWAPLVTSLSGVQPNPFRGSTQIHFSLAAPGRARLTLYDVAGRLVTTIQDQEWPAGQHALEWNGRSSSGQVASGIYFLRFDAGDRRETRRVVLLGGSR